MGKENILSAVVHLDEETLHMHLVYIPVVNSKNKQGDNIRKISASEFWKGIELNACYDIIKELFNKNEKMEKILEDRLGTEVLNRKNGKMMNYFNE